MIVKGIVGEEKMTDLESKNPQLKELGDFVYGRVQEASIADSPPSSPRSRDGSPQPSPRSRDDSPEVIGRGCFFCVRTR